MSSHATMLDGGVLLNAITDQYLKSPDFNGLDSRLLATAAGISESEVIESLVPLVESGSVIVLTPTLQENPAIIRVDPPSIERQLASMQSPTGESWWSVWAYPSPTHLRTVVDPSTYVGRPFTLRLALGEPHLRHQAFDLRALEPFRNDPRYEISADDMGGRMHFKEEYEDQKALDSDGIYLHTFGYCFDEQNNRALAVFLSYLARLSPEQQQAWNRYALKGNWMLHPDYRRSALFGDYPQGMSSYEALTEVLAHVNVMCEAAGWKPLFKRDFRGDARPKHFGFLIRPTAREYEVFVQVLDKMLSENINADFFPSTIRRFSVDRVNVKTQRGTISLLEEWLTRSFRVQGNNPIPEIIGTTKKVRKLRSPSSHEIHEDEWDPKYNTLQRDLMKEVLDSVDLLRAVLAINPKAARVAVPEALKDCPIYHY